MEYPYLLHLTIKHSALFYILLLKKYTMLPETILRSDVLDIVFENRNKTYGAYLLRKQYNNRLATAVASVVLFALLFSLWQYFSKGGNDNSRLFAIPEDNGQLITVSILNDAPKPAPKPPPEIKPPQQVKFISNIQIVKTLLIDSIPAVKFLDENVTGAETTKGEMDAKAAGMGPSPAGNGAQEELKPAVLEEETGPVEFAEKMPQFPGGEKAFQKFMQHNLTQPDDLEAGEKIVVLVRFVVEKDGSIAGAEVINSGRKDLNGDVLKAVNKMPKWMPGMRHGKNVAVYFKLPVTFMSIEQ